jgi:hypothetical protein
MAAVFISYRRDDSGGYAGRLHEELEERLGPDQVFRDVDTLQPGQDFVNAIEARLRECRVCLVLVGRGWLAARDDTGHRRLDRPDDYVRAEIAAALARAEVLVVPVLVGGAVLPGAEQLPESLRALARRQAVVLRDDAWEGDVDRLAAAVGPAIGRPLSGTEPAHPNRSGRRRGIAVAGAALAALVLAAVWFVRDGTDGAAPPGVAAASEPTDDAAGGEPSGIVHAIEVPPTPEIAHGDLIYTVLAGSVRTEGPRRTLWLRVRASNEGGQDANLWDQSFRVAVGGEVVAASGGLNEILSGHSIRQVVVRFEIPSGDPRARLLVTDGSRTGELPLTLTGSGGSPRHDQADPGDALSRASIRALVRDPAPLVATGDLRATLTRASARRFANTIRVAVSVRLENRGSLPRASSDVVLRLAEGGEVLAPWRMTNEVIDSGATLTADATFDVQASATAVVLRGTVGPASGEIPLVVQ